MTESMKTGAHAFEAKDGFDRTVTVRVESENVSVTGDGTNEGLFLYVSGSGAFLEREDAEQIRDFLLERYPAPREVGTATVKIVPDLTEFRQKIEEAARDAARVARSPFDGFNLGEEPEVEEEPLAAWERELLGMVEATREFEAGQTVRLNPRTRDFSAETGSLATVDEVDPDRWGGRYALKVRWHDEISQSDGFYDARDFEPFQAEPAGDVEGVIAYVTGDGDEWGHGFEPGTAVRLGRDDVAIDGSYYVEAVKTGEGQYVGANDLEIDSPHRQEIATGARVRVLHDGHESGLRHYLKPDTHATVEGWTDTSAESGTEYDVTYQVRGVSDEVGGSLVQSVTPDTIQREDTFQEIMRKYLEGYPRRFVTGVDWRDPAVKTWSEIMRPAPIMAIPDEVKIGRRRCVCGSASCPIGPFSNG